MVDDTVLVMGNWSAGMVRYHEPIRGKGWRKVLKQHGFRVYLIDEFRLSSICPVCNHGLETFRYVRNPRSWQLDTNPWVKCHGLLRCQNENCLESVAGPKGFKRRRLWNRDIAAVLNLKHTLVGLRENNASHAKRQMEKAIPSPKTKSVFDPKPKRKPRRIPIARRKFNTRPRRNPGREYKRKDKRKTKREAKREAKAAAPPKQLSAKRPFADVDSGSIDKVSPVKLLKDVSHRG
ncbi:hypothetical protein H4R99_005971 [Coemansia sp. RSA 1722]|nr:hypothetical protein H4R99_005971 [Coemansia sp. RSA 1722]